MKSLVLAAMMAVNPAPTYEMKVYFGYFMKGTNTAPVDQAASKAMMEGHLKNLTAIMLERNGLAAGPLQDPTKQRRGIVAFQAKNQEEALKNFDNDPFVKNNIMSVQLMEWKADPKLFTIAKADPNSLTEYRLVILTPGKSMLPVNDAILKDHRDYVQSLTKTHQLRAHGEIQSPFKIREIGIFEGKDDKAIEEALKNDPLVKSSLLEVEILPLWMSKGIFGP